MVAQKFLPLLTILVFSASASASASAEQGWYHSYQEARDAADAGGLPLLIHFHASYCGPCRQMNAQVFSRADVKRQLREGIAAVEIDVQSAPQLAQQYGATTVPRDVVIFPDGSFETVNTGFKSTHAYMNLLRTVASRGAEFAKPADASVAASEPAPSTKTAADIIGLEGFCPVRLIQDREWISGREDLKVTYRGITYYFSSEQARTTFEKDPAGLTPQNLGCDPVVLYSDQQAVTGKIKYGAFFDSKLFLFDTVDNRKSFKQNPLKYSLIRHAVKVDEMSGRRFN